MRYFCAQERPRFVPVEQVSLILALSPPMPATRSALLEPEKRNFDTRVGHPANEISQPLSGLKARQYGRKGYGNDVGFSFSFFAQRRLRFCQTALASNRQEPTMVPPDGDDNWQAPNGGPSGQTRNPDNPNVNRRNDGNSNNGSASGGGAQLLARPVNVQQLVDPLHGPEHFGFATQAQYLEWFAFLGEIKSSAHGITMNSLELRNSGQVWIPQHRHDWFRWRQVVLRFILRYGPHRVPRDIKWALRDAEENLGLPVTFPNAEPVDGE